MSAEDYYCPDNDAVSVRQQAASNEQSLKRGEPGITSFEVQVAYFSKGAEDPYFNVEIALKTLSPHFFCSDSLKKIQLHSTDKVYRWLAKAIVSCRVHTVDESIYSNILAAKLVTSAASFGSVRSFLDELEPSDHKKIFEDVQNAVSFQFQKDVLAHICDNSGIVEARHFQPYHHLSQYVTKSLLPAADASKYLTLAHFIQFDSSIMEKCFDYFVTAAKMIREAYLFSWVESNLAKCPRQTLISPLQLREIADTFLGKEAEDKMKDQASKFVDLPLGEWVQLFK